MKLLIHLFLPATAALSFATLGLNSKVQNSCYKLNWTAPTDVQSKAIPQILNDRYQNVCVESQTGSGKTGAFGLPLLQLLDAQKKLSMSEGDVNPKSISSLVLVPTRELACQVVEVLQNISKGMDSYVSCFAVYGGVPIQDQIDAFVDIMLEKGEDEESRFPDVVVATPGRLLDIVTKLNENPGDLALESNLTRALDAANKGRADATINLAQIELQHLDQTQHFSGMYVGTSLFKALKYLVIDEADRLLGNAFAEEVDALMEAIALNQETRKILVSATFSETMNMKVRTLLKDSVAEGEPRKTIYIVSQGTDCTSGDELQESQPRKKTAAPISTIVQRVIRIEEENRTQALRRLIEDNQNWNRVLVFVSSRYLSEHISRKLRRAGITSHELHGKLDQETRQMRLKRFRNAKIQVLIATDLASRGLDISGLPVVVNYDLPRSPADFIHRVGRTGRAQKSGEAITFITPENEDHFKVIEKRYFGRPGSLYREVLSGYEPDEVKWDSIVKKTNVSVPGTQHSRDGLAFDKMHGGVKGKRKSKKDKLRDAVAAKAEADEAQSVQEGGL